MYIFSIPTHCVLRTPSLVGTKPVGHILRFLGCAAVFRFREGGGKFSPFQEASNSNIVSAGVPNMEVVLVTAGNGFVGQHFIKHLQSQGPSTLREIRVLDEKAFENQLDYDARVPIKSFIGTVFELSTLDHALTGVDTVVHLYELKDTSMLPDRKAMKRINVEGTRAIIEACESRPHILRFLLLSSSDVMLCNHVACDANVTEIWAIPEGKWAYPDYCASKYEAEKVAFSIDNFQCMAARLGPVYGELDDEEWGFAAHLKLGKKYNGLVPVLGDRQGTIMHTYVGNAAYGMVRILDKMINDPTATKEAVFLLDDTPLIEFYSIMEPIVNAKGYKLHSIPVWFMLLFIPYCILEKFAQWTERIYCFGLKGCLKKLPAARILYNYCYTYTTFSAFKGLTYIDYKPLYTHQQTLEHCIKYYASNQV